MALNEHGGTVAEATVDGLSAHRSPDDPSDRSSGAVADLAGEFGAELVRAIRVGLAQGGSSAYALRGPSQLSWYDFATEYARAHWPGRAAKTRDEVSEALTAVTLAMLWDLPGRPGGPLLRRSLRRWAFVVTGPGREEAPAEDRLVLQWVARASRPLEDFQDPVLARDVLESLRRKTDGGEAAVETMRRKRKVLVHALHYAVERGELGSHPLNRVRWRLPKPAVSVDPRVVANPHQARDLLNAVSYVGGYSRARGRRLVGFFAGMYYAGLRPEEAVAVELPDCRLPTTGWGRLVLHRTRPQAGKRWTDTGEFHDERGLKNRPPGDTRVVPLPPHLVAMWREHVTTFGTAEGGRLFFTEQGRVIGYTAFHRVGEEARALTFPPAPSPHHWPGGRTICGTPRCPPGCARARIRPRSPSGPGTASRCCSAGTRNASTTGSPSTTSASKGSSAPTTSRTA
ncbi:site-specific integrase [Streptomyces sp. NPDC056716]|uniref:site-specific integrase n=1 Tax=unclassified Streptomyces TaxID=2593676 RepID=UPI00367701CA